MKEKQLIHPKCTLIVHQFSAGFITGSLRDCFGDRTGRINATRSLYPVTSQVGKRINFLLLLWPCLNLSITCWFLLSEYFYISPSQISSLLSLFLILFANPFPLESFHSLLCPCSICNIWRELLQADPCSILSTRKSATTGFDRLFVPLIIFLEFMSS